MTLFKKLFRSNRSKAPAPAESVEKLPADEQIRTGSEALDSKLVNSPVAPKNSRISRKNQRRKKLRVQRSQAAARRRKNLRLIVAHLELQRKSELETDQICPAEGAETEFEESVVAGPDIERIRKKRRKQIEARKRNSERIKRRRKRRKRPVLLIAEVAAPEAKKIDFEEIESEPDPISKPCGKRRRISRISQQIERLRKRRKHLVRSVRGLARI